MRNYFILVLFLILLAACETRTGDPDEGTPVPPGKKAIFMSIGDNLSFDYNEVHLYDSSSHVIIFEESHQEFDKLRNDYFALYAEGDTIYQGQFWPAYLSSHPEGAYISSTPLWMQNYALKVDFVSRMSATDPRNKVAFINALKSYDKLRSGLLVRIGRIEKIGSQLKFSFNVTNMDRDELLIMDPDKMGINLFHYFTNGLVIQNLSTNEITTASVTPRTPAPANGWQADWLSVISSGGTKSYTFSYNLRSTLIPGNYKVTFIYPGLTSQVSFLNLYQKGTRIWLGDITVSSHFTI